MEPITRIEFVVDGDHVRAIVTRPGKEPWVNERALSTVPSVFRDTALAPLAAQALLIRTIAIVEMVGVQGLLSNPT